MASIDSDRLIAACSDDGADAGITIRTEFEPLGGPGAKVKPAVYAGGVFQQGKRWWGDGDDRAVVDVITIDNEPSQANRLEAALERLRPTLGLPEMVLDLSSLEPLPPHVPRSLSSFRFPHRNADAYLRDAELDGTDFLRSDIGRAVFAATADDADALLEWMPQALLYGFWQSHLGKKGSQAKLARSWVSEIIGIGPAATDPERVEAVKGDPYNLTVAERVDHDSFNESNWSVLADGEKPSLPTAKGEKKKYSLSEIGHGQALAERSGTNDQRPLAGVSFARVVQQSTVSFASLRRIYASAGQAEARALLVALGLVAHALAFGRAFNLRSGCDLRPASTSWTWLGASGDEEMDALAVQDAEAVFRAVTARAEAAGLPVGTRWSAPMTLTPKSNLRKVIRQTFPEPDTDVA